MKNLILVITFRKLDNVYFSLYVDKQDDLRFWLL